MSRRPSRVAVLVSSALSLLGCSSSSATPAAPDDAATADAIADAEAPPASVRGQRYCELLLATLNGGNLHVEVWNTFGLDDCPDAAWKAIDPPSLAQQLGVTQVVMNGPRYWMIDQFVSAAFVDPTPKTLGGIAMRHAANIDMPASAASSPPYSLHSIQRSTVVRFAAGSRVYELVDPQGKIYDMQSYSVQKSAQTEADLANLGAKLGLPAGWTFRSRVLTADLDVTAVGGIAAVVQDDFQNTYQQSQQ
jgi:hypothetical protein